MAWPVNFPKPTKLTERYVKEQYKTTFETGAVLSRPKHLMSKHIFSLRWEGLSSSNVDLIKIAFNADLGTVFDWPHPKGHTLKVRYAKGEIVIDRKAHGFDTVSLELEEA